MQIPLLIASSGYTCCFLLTVTWMFGWGRTLKAHSAWSIVENIPKIPWSRKDCNHLFPFRILWSVFRLYLYAFPMLTLLCVHVFLQAGESGSADTVRDPRGFAMKFYTEDGNWDLVGNNTPIFFIRDPLLVSKHKRWGCFVRKPRSSFTSCSGFPQKQKLLLWHTFKLGCLSHCPNVFYLERCS